MAQSSTSLMHSLPVLLNLSCWSVNVCLLTEFQLLLLPLLIRRVPAHLKPTAAVSSCSSDDIQTVALVDAAVRKATMRYSMQLAQQLRNASGQWHTIIAQVTAPLSPSRLWRCIPWRGVVRSRADKCVGKRMRKPHDRCTLACVRKLVGAASSDVTHAQSSCSLASLMHIA